MAPECAQPRMIDGLDTPKGTIWGMLAQHCSCLRTEAEFVG